ncbi:UNVERIFIED_CONTAM: hypothetical protein FKN15_060290 [Acipenser sinensis]
MHPLKRVPANLPFFALRIHSEATTPIVPVDNTDLNASTAELQAPISHRGCCCVVNRGLPCQPNPFLPGRRSANCAPPPRKPGPYPATVEEPVLRHVEKDVLIPKLMREKAKERCSEKVHVDDAVTLYNATLTHIIDAAAPLTTRTIKKDRNCPWYTLELPMYIGNCVREFTLNIKYTFNIIPENEPYFHPATIVCQIKDVVCMPNGVMTVVAVTMEPIPVVEPSKSTLLDKTCKPKEFDSTRALFTFSVNTCGTRS